MKKLLVKDGIFTPAQKQAFYELSPELDVRFVTKKDVEEFPDASAIIGNFNPLVLKSCKKLEWMGLESSGADFYAKDENVPAETVITTATGAYGIGISEYMVAMLLNMMKRVPAYLENQKNGIWRDEGSVTTPIGKRLLIVGTGNLGSEFAKRIRVFGCKVVGIRRRSGNVPEYFDEIHSLEELPAELAKADIVALCLPGTPDTYHLMDAEMLKKCKTGAYLMNVGRGNVIPLDDLLKKEVTERFAGIWIDVAEIEPLPDNHPVYSVENLLITPHITGGNHLDLTVQNIFEINLANAKAWLTDGEFKSVLDRSTGYCK